LADLTALHRAEVLLRREGDPPTADCLSALADRLQEERERQHRLEQEKMNERNIGLDLGL